MTGLWSDDPPHCNSGWDPWTLAIFEREQRRCVDGSQDHDLGSVLDDDGRFVFVEPFDVLHCIRRCGLFMLQWTWMCRHCRDHVTDDDIDWTWWEVGVDMCKFCSKYMPFPDERGFHLR